MPGPSLEMLGQLVADKLDDPRCFGRPLAKIGISRGCSRVENGHLAAGGIDSERDADFAEGRSVGLLGFAPTPAGPSLKFTPDEADQSLDLALVRWQK